MCYGKEGIHTKTAAYNGGSTSNRGHHKEDAVMVGRQPKEQGKMYDMMAQN